ncbi:MAG: leucine-rich repeat protein [Clostridia bacterium]|nr:leucine-rich repeat protein [Clostridia bacterium]
MKNKSFISVLCAVHAFCILLLCGILPASAEAEQSPEILKYTVSGGEVELVNVNPDTEGDYVIPEFLSDYPVTSIGFWAFENCKKITSVSIPGSVKSIESGAFYGCSSLENVSFAQNSSLSEIYPMAFAGCVSLKSITIPENVEVIADRTFSGCSNLRDVDFSDNIIRIERGAFSGTGLEEDESNRIDGVLYHNNCLIEVNSEFSGNLSVKPGTRLIAEDAFWYCSKITSVNLPESLTADLCDCLSCQDCTSLKTITVDENNPEYCSEDGVLFSKDKTELITYPLGRTDLTYTVSDGVNRLSSYSFYCCESLMILNIPETVQEIHTDFIGCDNLKIINFDGSLEQWKDANSYSNPNINRFVSVFCRESSVIENIKYNFTNFIIFITRTLFRRYY